MNDATLKLSNSERSHCLLREDANAAKHRYEVVRLEAEGCQAECATLRREVEELGRQSEVLRQEVKTSEERLLALQCEV